MEEFLANFCDLLEDTPQEEINKETIFRDIDDWDSMTMLMLIGMFDEKYGKEITASDLNKLETVEQLFELSKK